MERDFAGQMFVLVDFWTNLSFAIEDTGEQAKLRLAAIIDSVIPDGQKKIEGVFVSDVSLVP